MVTDMDDERRYDNDAQDYRTESGFGGFVSDEETDVVYLDNKQDIDERDDWPGSDKKNNRRFSKILRIIYVISVAARTAV